MSASQDIVQWSANRPAWQRDALRRLVQKGSLDAVDIDELVLIARASHRLGDAPSADPLVASHMRGGTGSDAAVSLQSVSDVKNVNALAPNQNLEFGGSGLTVIYGGNGSGKSGYFRILKKICRARGADVAILANVFEPAVDEPAQAVIKYIMDSKSRKLPWEQGIPAPEELSRVNVFDSMSAAVYTTSEQDVAYVPFGLDLLPKLVEACRLIRAILQRERAADVSGLAGLDYELQDTDAGRWLATLARETTAEDVASHTAYTDTDEAERVRMSRALDEKRPEVRADELDAQRTRYGHLKSRLDELTKIFGVDNLDGLQKKHRDLQGAEQVAALSFAQLTEGSKIDGVGTDAWFQMWVAAQRFAEEAHLIHESEALAKSKTCPLCQQPLGEDATDRFAQFAKHFATESTTLATNARVTFDLTHRELVATDLDREAEATVVAELRLQDPTSADNIDGYVAACRSVQDLAKRVTAKVDWPTLPTVPRLDLSGLDGLVDTLRDDAKTLRDIARAPERTKLIEAHRELGAKRWLSDHRTQIQTEVSRRDRLSRLEKAEADTTSTGITLEATNLTKKYVTDELRRVFTEELEGMSSAAPQVRLVGAPGELGVSHYTIVLDTVAEERASVASAVSEGEDRAVSLAAFLSELSTEESNSAVVLDDPISSFDIANRERCARRMAQLAVDRQVIVFTHDLFFLVSLMGESDRMNIECKTTSVSSMPFGHGVVTNDVPWEARKFSDQIGALKLRCQEIRAGAGEVEPNVYQDQLSSWRVDFRNAIERAVEEVLLSAVVLRFQRQIRVTNIGKVAAVSDSDVELLDDLMTEYSKHEHSQPLESHIPAPSIDQLEQDAIKLESWVRDFRRKTRDL